MRDANRSRRWEGLGPSEMWTLNSFPLTNFFPIHSHQCSPFPCGKSTYRKPHPVFVLGNLTIDLFRELVLLLLDLLQHDELQAATQFPGYHWAELADAVQAKAGDIEFGPRYGRFEQHVWGEMREIKANAKAAPDAQSHVGIRFHA